MSDGLKKNLEVVQDELKAWGRKMADGTRRLSKPSLNPKNREHFVPHVLVGMLKDTIHELSRLWTYLIVIALISKLIRFLVS